MGSTVLPVTPPGSLDRWGLSIATATRTAADPRAGAIYHPADFAAAVPVYCHPMGGARYLMLCDRYWTNATPATGAAGRYSTHTAVNAVSAAVVDAALGSAAPARGCPGYALDFRLPTWTTARLVNAASVARFCYLLLDTDTGPVLAIWRLDPDDAFVVVNQVRLPDLVTEDATVRWNRGVYVDGPYLYLWGSDTVTHAVYTARVFTSKVGIAAFDYQSDTGWHPDGATPVVGGLTTLGPCSTVVFRKRTYLTTVALVGSDYVGRVWSSKTMTQPWALLAEHTINAAGAWLGNGLMLQPQVNVNYAEMPPDAAAALPMTWTRAAADGGAGLDVCWDLLPIPASMA